MELPTRIRDSRLVSSPTGRDADDAGGGRALGLGGLAAVLLSVSVSVVGYGVLPGRLRIHWTAGMGPYYGPEFAPSLLVLALFPALVAGIAVGAYWLAAWLHRFEEFGAVRPYYVASVLGTLAILLGSQGALIAANL